jgi:hypothetical protein
MESSSIKTTSSSSSEAHRKLDKKRPRTLPSNDDSTLEPQLKKPLFAIPPTISTTSDSHSKDKPKQKAKTKFVYKYGNYAGYYGYRLDSQGNDPRIDLLDSQWFTGKKILDIGCNSGVLTIRLAKKHAVESIRGVDIDNSLILRAKKNLQDSNAPQIALSQATNSHTGKFHGGGKLAWNQAISSSSDPNSHSATSSPDSSTIAHHVPIIEFETDNYLTKLTEANSYDTILWYDCTSFTDKRKTGSLIHIDQLSSACVQLKCCQVDPPELGRRRPEKSATESQN